MGIPVSLTETMCLPTRQPLHSSVPHTICARTLADYILITLRGNNAPVHKCLSAIQWPFPEIPRMLYHMGPPWPESHEERAPIILWSLIKRGKQCLKLG